jgi:hypothetical protein
MIVHGKECKFVYHSDEWSVWHGSHHLTALGWRWAPTKDAPSFDTMREAEDFARLVEAQQKQGRG